MKYFVLPLIALGMAASPAAAEVGGLRTEIIVGYDAARTPVLTKVAKPNGFLYGGSVGYDFKIGKSAAIGIDGEMTMSTGSFTVTSGNVKSNVDFGRDIYVGGRFTLAASDNVNLYLKAGYSAARLRERVTVGNTTSRVKGTADGIRVGVGAQFAIGSKAYFGPEYRYSNYESGISRHQIGGVLGFRF